MIPKNWWNTPNTGTQEEQLKTIGLFLKDVYNILNKGITLSDNLKGALFEVEFAVSNADVQIRHGLDFVPVNYIVCGTDAAIHIYDGSQSGDKTFFYLRASATGNARVFIF